MGPRVWIFLLVLAIAGCNGPGPVGSLLATGDLRPMGLSGDGFAIAYDTTGIYAIRVEDGERRTIATPCDPLAVVRGTVAVVRCGAALWLWTAADGPRQVTESVSIDRFGFSLSPDGSWLLYSRPDDAALRLVATGGGGERVVPNRGRVENLYFVDDRAVVLTYFPQPGEVSSIELATGQDTVLVPSGAAALQALGPLALVERNDGSAQVFSVTGGPELATINVFSQGYLLPEGAGAVFIDANGGISRLRLPGASIQQLQSGQSSFLVPATSDRELVQFDSPTLEVLVASVDVAEPPTLLCRFPAACRMSDDRGFVLVLTPDGASAPPDPLRFRFSARPFSGGEERVVVSRGAGFDALAPYSALSPVARRLFEDEKPRVGDRPFDVEYVDLANPSPPIKVATRSDFLVPHDGARLVYHYAGGAGAQGLYVSKIPP